MAAPRQAPAAPAPAAAAPRARWPLYVAGAVGLVVVAGGVGAGAMYMLGGNSSEGASVEAGHGAPEAAEGAAADGGHGAPPAEGGHGAPAEGGHSAPAESGHGAPSAGGHGETAPVIPIGFGAVAEDSMVSIGDFTVNLRGAGGGRVLRMAIFVQAAPGRAGAVQAAQPQLRDSTLTLASDYTYDEIEGLDGKTRLREELMQRMNAILGPDSVQNLYFTEFVVQ